MQNDPDLHSQSKYLGTLTKDFVKIASVMREASYQIRQRKMSDFPIFPVSKGDAPIGQKLIGKNDREFLDWDFHISFLEEFVSKNVIEADKIDPFKMAYKNPDEFCCLFVYDDDFVNFVYIPFPVDEETGEIGL